MGTKNMKHREGYEAFAASTTGEVADKAGANPYPIQRISALGDLAADEAVFPGISFLNEVYFYNGSPLVYQDLENAQIKAAIAVVILSRHSDM